MEDDSESVSAPGTDAADAVLEVHSVAPTAALYRTMTNGENDTISSSERHDLDTRLHPRALLREDELSTGEIHSRFVQQDRHLKWEDVLAVHVLMQAVEVVRAVLKQ
ncbi:hypothetical protein PX52LOC_02374 [Limnoglobus roseus]|uniref:Uncharacterized protein n=1 Tax=Limnoglobus roseus TaxID=2598579 RepID=A0A5C1AE99_9BACT|nr:hypothetical protein PX52LOC_02374 [Limnoglobus roseus]